MTHIKETDWKYLRKIQSDIVNRHCEAILEYFEMIIQNRHGEEHKSYLQISIAVKKKDKELAITYNDINRSNALLKICEMRRHLAMTDEEFERFSQETKDIVNRILSIEL